MNWKWAENGNDLMKQSYVPAKKAMYYSMNNAIGGGYSLPYRQVNTFDEHGWIGDLNAHNSIIYIVSLYAMREMSLNMSDSNMTSILTEQIAYAKGAFRDTDKWEDFTLNSGSLWVYLLNDTHTGLEYYQTILTKYADLYHDQWDYRIMSHYFGFNQNDTNKPLIGIDLPGSDSFNSPHTVNGCSGYTNTQPLCWLKSGVPEETTNICVTSGIDHHVLHIMIDN